VKGKLKIILPLALLLVLGGLYKVVLARPPVVHHKVDGQVYVLPKEFLLNLAGNHFVKLNVGLVLADGEVPTSAEGGTPPPEGFGPLPQEAVVRDVITDTITDASSDQLVSRKGRNALKAKLLKSLRARTDVKVKDVLFTDVAVQ
jgi:flagellar basal body-associated protein FliL